MNKSAIQKFAIQARRDLIEQVKQRAYQYGIDEKGYGDINAVAVSGRVLSSAEKLQRQELIRQIQQKGYAQEMEEVAYTWFNRFIALRFMEVNNYLPSHIRVFSDASGSFSPEILKDALHLDLPGLDKGKVAEYIESNSTDDLYRYLLLTQCNALNEALPVMFQRMGSYTEMLLPNNILRQDSVLGHMVADIPEEDWQDQVQIIGWMYQYYISEKHDEVINIYKGTIKKEDIPAATQLFTTDWVVRYMVDNSLGRFWIERNPQSKLQDKLDYFVTSKNGHINYIDDSVQPQDLTFFDPCMGSGHILVYAFDVLMEIYRECGYSDRDAAAEIVENNLFGLDIDERCSQLAYFTVMMKARSFDRRFLSRGIVPHVMEIKESNAISSFTHGKTTPDAEMNKIGEYLLQSFRDAKEIGSLQNIQALNYSAFETYLKQCEPNGQMTTDDSYWCMDVKPLVGALSSQAKILSSKYAVVCTNPPYMNKLEGKLKDFVVSEYKAYSGDLFSTFIFHDFSFCKSNGYSAFMTPFVWMFIKTYEALRAYILDSKALVSLIQMEYSAFEEATVPICSFVLKNGKSTEPSYCFRLSDFKGGMEIQKQKVLEAITNKDCGYFFESAQANFSKIPGSPIAYWASSIASNAFVSGSVFPGETKKGVLTGDNDRFLRLWHEVSFIKSGYHMSSHDEMASSMLKWFPVTSGGFMRKWYGNFDTVVNLENDGFDIRTTVRNFRLRESTYYFKEAITWTEVSSGIFSCRYVPTGILFGNGGPVSFFFNENLRYTLGFLNSKVVMSIMAYLAPTINYGPEQIKKLPVIYSRKNVVESIVSDNIVASKEDWDSYETSWDFTQHPLVALNQGAGYGTDMSKWNYTVKSAYEAWNRICNDRFKQLKANEEELNRIFIDIYGLQDELTPEVEDKDITVRKADLGRDIRSLISYAVGCMFGRYSLDVEGLAYAGGDWDDSKYSTFTPDRDNVIPICDDEYFDDDITGRFVQWVETVYGKETLEENLKFIADALGGKGSPREVIRSYFLNDFYADHLKVYQKRPIYWLFDSGKKNGFKALIYMHRYQRDLLARMRTDYVHEQQERYRTQLTQIGDALTHASGSEAVKLSKQQKKIQEQSLEIQKYEEKIHHLADQNIEIDLDDGVKHNYALFEDVLAKIK